MSYFKRASDSCKELERFICKISKCSDIEIPNIMNQSNISVYNNKINELFSIFIRTPIDNNQDTKNFNLELLNCLGKTISFFLPYYEINFRINGLDAKSILCKSVVENILEKFMDNKNSEKIFISILKNMKFYFFEQNNNYKEITKVYRYLEAINILFEHLISKNELFFGKVNTADILILKEKFDKINCVFIGKKNNIEKKMAEEKENRFRIRLEQLKLQLEESENFFDSLSLKKNKNIKEHDSEKIVAVGLENLDLSELIETPTIPSFDDDFFQREIKCIEEFKNNKKSIESFEKK